MKIIILKNNLKNSLDAISRVGGEGINTLPILKNFLIETVDNKLKLSATNLELAVISFAPAKVVEDGGLTIPFGVFYSIINNLQAERINLEKNENNLIIKTDNYEAKIQGIKKDEFPIIPKINNIENYIEIPTTVFNSALSSVVNTAQVSDIKPELSGIFFDYQMNVLKLASTDSFRLAEKTLFENQFKSNFENKFRAIIPLKTIQEAIKIFKEENNKVQVFFDQNQILFKDENFEIISRLISGEFPNYQPIIPQSVETEIILNKEELVNALKLTSSFSNRFNEVKIIIKESAKNIEVYSFNQELGENKYLIPAKIKSPNNLEIIFNWRFIFDGLKNIDSEAIFLGLNGDNKPVLVKSPNDVSYFYILMPIKSGY